MQIVMTTGIDDFEVTVNDGATIAHVLENALYDLDKVVVTLNSEVIDRTAFETTSLKEGDKLHIKEVFD